MLFGGMQEKSYPRRIGVVEYVVVPFFLGEVVYGFLELIRYRLEKLCPLGQHFLFSLHLKALNVLVEFV